MARSVSWRRRCPGDVATRTELASRATFYIVHQTGPTAFVVKEEGRERKIKVCLGDRHVCSCSSFKREKELCLHILWVLLKKFRIPRDNPITYQLGLVEREISEVLQGSLRRQKAEQSNQSDSLTESRDQTCPKAITSDDVCPICQEGLLGGKSAALTYCKFGCGNSVHIKCMKIWAEHQRSSQGEETIKCPLCREDFGTYQELCKEFHSVSSRRGPTGRSSLHLGVTCSHCHLCPISGKCYRCTVCACYHLCQACFSSNQYHVTHPFEFRQHTNQPWRPASRATNRTPASPSTGTRPTLSPALISSLQSRSLTENDYELLLQLDQPHTSTTATSHLSPRGVPDRVISSFHVEPVDSAHPLLVGGAVCPMCRGGYRRGDWLRKLPCKHKFHRDCIDQWLRSGGTTCPMDGQPVCPATRRAGERKKTQNPPTTNHTANEGGYRGKRATGPSISRALSLRPTGTSSNSRDEFSVSGHGIRHSGIPTPQLSTRPSLINQKSGTGVGVSVADPAHPSRTAVGTGLLPKLSSVVLPRQQRQQLEERRCSTRSPRGRQRSEQAWRDRQRGSVLSLSSPSSSSSSSLRAVKRPHLTDAINIPGPSSSQTDFTLSPMCSGYLHPSLVHQPGTERERRGRPSLPAIPPSTPPANGQLRKGFVAVKSSDCGTAPDPTQEDCDLDSSLRVSSFKLCSLPPTSSLVMAQQS